MFRIERRVGRFAELRFGSLFTITEMPEEKTLIGVMQADNRARRVFREARELQSWLSPFLTAGEGARLEEFLNSTD